MSRVTASPIFREFCPDPLLIDMLKRNTFLVSNQSKAENGGRTEEIRPRKTNHRR